MDLSFDFSLDRSDFLLNFSDSSLDFSLDRSDFSLHFSLDEMLPLDFGLDLDFDLFSFSSSSYFYFFFRSSFFTKASISYHFSLSSFMVLKT